jgi:hypothetical protein
MVLLETMHPMRRIHQTQLVDEDEVGTKLASAVDQVGYSAVPLIRRLNIERTGSSQLLSTSVPPAALIDAELSVQQPVIADP